jgi:hypothetical protein
VNNNLIYNDLEGLVWEKFKITQASVKRIIIINNLYVLKRPDVRIEIRVPAIIPPVVSIENDLPGK